MDQQAAQKLAQVMEQDCIAFRVRALNRVITNLYDAALAPFNLTVNQATMLIMLALVGEATPGRIGQVLIMEKSTISRNLDRMKKQGWVASTGRAVQVTPAGRTLLAAFHPSWEAAQQQAAELLGSNGVAAVNALHVAVRKKHPI
jgi:DNA-binding MarR family transcriptional regulator